MLPMIQYDDHLYQRAVKSTDCGQSNPEESAIRIIEIFKSRYYSVDLDAVSRDEMLTKNDKKNQ